MVDVLSILKVVSEGHVLKSTRAGRGTRYPCTCESYVVRGIRE